MSTLHRVLSGLALVLGLVWFLHTLLASNAWTQRERVSRDLERLRHSNAADIEELDTLRTRISALRQRPEVRERAVRHELGFLRADEATSILPSENRKPLN